MMLKKILKLCASTAICMLIYANAASAVTFSSSADAFNLPFQNSCSSTGAGTGNSSVSCSFSGNTATANARAQKGSLGVSASLNFNGLFFAIDDDFPQVVAQARVTDRLLSFGADIGVARLEYIVDGSVDFQLQKGNNTREPFGGVSLGISTFDVNGKSVGGGSIFVQSSNDGPLHSDLGKVDFFEIFVEGGKFDFTTILTARVSCDDLERGSTCLASGNFFNSLNFVGATFFDLDGKERPDVRFVSESGFDYQNGGQISAVPLPGAGVLLLAAFGIFASVRSKRILQRSSKI